jgi:CheY-like chemotaxis protein
VDDNKVIRQLIRVNLELEGLEVVTAADGAECLDVVHQVLPDVITLDVVMPRLDGLRTAARLRSDPRTRHLPIAIVSACSQYEVEAGLDVGVDAFLAKPFEPAELVKLVRELVARTERGRMRRGLAGDDEREVEGGGSGAAGSGSGSALGSELGSGSGSVPGLAGGDADTVSRPAATSTSPSAAASAPGTSAASTTPTTSVSGTTAITPTTSVSGTTTTT